MSKIFGELRKKILALMFLHEDQAFYVREVAARIGASPMGASKELRKLEAEGIVVAESKGLQKFYSLNKRNPTYNELRGLVLKSFGLVDVIKEAIAGIKGVNRAFIYGSLAKEEADYQSDIDVFIIGNVDYQQMSATIENLSRQVGREVNVDLMEADEYQRRLAEKDPYILSLEKKIDLVENGRKV